MSTIIRRIQDGDTRAFRQIIDQHQQLVYHIVARLVDNPADRDDICQDIFVKVYEQLPHFRGDSKLSTWIGRIAWHRYINFLRKKQYLLHDDILPETTIENTTDSGLAPDGLAEKKDQAERIRKLVEAMPEKYRTILTLYHVEELTYHEIATITGFPEGTVKSHLFRARKWLKNQLEQSYTREDLQ